jgi:NTE family protein
MPYKEERSLLRRMVISLSHEILTYLRMSPFTSARNPEVSLHTFPCDYLIACNAGQGLMSGGIVPLGFMTRVSQSFQIVHRRVQDSTMKRLHQLREAGLIKGFALPYLGQQDSRLPWRPPALVPREEVIGYPTNLASMSARWIDKLSERGEQLTRALVSYYLRDLLHT